MRGVRRRPRDWRDPFEWFNWYYEGRPQLAFEYKPGTNIEHLNGTFARADATTCATYVDANGIVQTVAANVLRDAHFVSGVRTTLLEGSRANLCPQSGSILTASGWSQFSGVAGQTSGQSDPSGGTTGVLLANAGSGNTDNGLNRAVAFTGDGTKAFSVFIKQGSSPTSDFAIYSVTAATFRHRVRATWTGGVPTLSTITGGGTLFTPIPCTNGWWRCMASASSVVAANDNRLAVFPDSSQAGINTNDSAFWGADAEDAAFPSSYIATAGSSVTRAADSLTFPIGFNPQILSVYFKQFAIGLAVSNAAAGVNIGATSNAGNRFMLYENGGALGNTRAQHTGSQSGACSGSPSTNDILEQRGILQADGSCFAGQSINGGTETVGTTSGVTALEATWSAQSIRVGSLAAGDYQCMVIGFKIALGPALSMAQLRAL